ncbi:MAG: hypothetical protein WC738_03240, partial [Candidatus Omnitrophota bacterium]
MKNKIIAIVAFVVVSVFVCFGAFAQDKNVLISALPLANAYDLLNGKVITVSGNDDADALLVKLQWNRSKILQTVQAENSVCRSTFGDIARAIRIANAFISDVVNPDVLNIIGLYLKDGALIVKYAVGKSTLTMLVDIETYQSGFDTDSQQYAYAALKTRKDIAAKMGISIKETYVNSVEELNLIHPCDAIYWDCALTVRISNFTLSFDYHTMQGLYEESSIDWIELKTFINDEAGIDLYKNALEYLKDTVDPESFILDGWKAIDTDADDVVDAISF